MSTIGFIGAKLNLLIRQGCDFGPFNVTLTNPNTTPVILTGCTIKGQIRRKAADKTVAAEFNVSITNAAQGQYSFQLSDDVTSALEAADNLDDPISKYVWDMVLLDSSGRSTPLYYGDVAVFRGVTRA